jgi:dienelactone hydrolase
MRPLAVVAALLLAAQAHALPEDPGTLSFTTATKTAILAGKSVTFDLYFPNQGKPAPIVVVGHGFQRKKGNMADWGKELARRGYVVAVPDFPGVFPDYPVNSKVVSELLSWMVNESQQAGTPLAGKVDGTRRAAVGYSAGGLAALLAASQDPAIDVVVGLDPIDNSGRGAAAAPAIKAPVTFIRAEPGSCNNNGNAASIFASLVAPRLSLKVQNATHCDGESPTGALCELVCGAQDKARHLLFRRYAFATLDYLLLCDIAMAPWLGGASAKADTGITDIVVQAGFPPQPGCAAAPDAGPPDDTGPTVDAVTADGPNAPDSRPPALDAGSSPPDAAPTGDASPPGGDGGCSCDVSGRGSPTVIIVVLMLMSVLSLLRTARRCRR